MSWILVIDFVLLVICILGAMITKKYICGLVAALLLVMVEIMSGVKGVGKSIFEFSAIICATSMMFLDGKQHGDDAFLFKYNPYNPNAKIPAKVRKAVLIVVFLVFVARILLAFHGFVQ